MTLYEYLYFEARESSISRHPIDLLRDETNKGWRVISSTIEPRSITALLEREKEIINVGDKVELQFQYHGDDTFRRGDTGTVVQVDFANEKFEVVPDVDQNRVLMHIKRDMIAPAQGWRHETIYR